MDNKNKDPGKRSLKDIFYMEESPELDEKDGVSLSEDKDRGSFSEDKDLDSSLEEADMASFTEDKGGVSFLKNRLSKSGMEKLFKETGLNKKENFEKETGNEEDLLEVADIVKDEDIPEKLENIDDSNFSAEEDLSATASPLNISDKIKTFEMDQDEDDEDFLRKRLLSEENDDADKTSKDKNALEDENNLEHDNTLKAENSLEDDNSLKDEKSSDNIFDPEETALFKRPDYLAEDNDNNKSDTLPGIKIYTREELEAAEAAEAAQAAENTEAAESFGAAEAARGPRNFEATGRITAEGADDDSGRQKTEDQKEISNKQENKKRSPLMSVIYEWVLPIAFALLLAIVIKNYIGGLSSVQGHSMEPTLHEGDMLFVNKLPTLFKSYKRGDILIIDSPDRVELYVKRLVGLPGETVEIKNGKVIINGKWLKDSWTDKETAVYNNSKWTLGPDQYFVLGDNREEGASNDSRIFGPISEETIEGVAKLRIWPLNAFKSM